uniref:Chromosome transmission fidelity protein 18 homolog n=1 Tax=Cyprinus carpio carpio TaxID=630221 RepID=A0A9J8CE97_CYPCA
MDEYDEMYGIEDDFEQQFADELEVMAEMDRKLLRYVYVSFLYKKVMQCLISLWFLTAPKPKKRRQDAVKKLQFGVENSDDITPPSSPEFMDSTVKLQVTTARRHAQKRPPAIGDFITVTDSMGNRVYLNKKEDEEKVSDPTMVEESQRLTELMNSGISPELLAEEQTDSGVDGDSGEDEGSSSRLWVDQFSPQHYTDLLSDDFTNRCLLKWLKLWDTVVFGRERKPRSAPADVRTNFTNAQNQNQSQRFKTKSQMTEEILEAELDQYKRPKFKVALLSGPPGLGKTTLAHIIAKHAGYNVVEINASDDRSAELFQKRIDTATQMKSVLGANEKPNCLIIDEIDGAPAAAINILLATLNRKDSKEGEESGVNALKKKKKKQSVLLRPIICICNDLYVPALRPLRQQAFLLAFPQTLPSRLAQRLAEITRRQGMKADTGTLMALCEKTDNDIRSCINTLQFLHRRGQKHLDQRSVNSISVGLKDQNKGLFSVWQEIFQLPRLKRKRIGGDPFGGFDEAGLKDGTQRLQHILHLVSSNGEHEKLTQGLYDNFLNMKLKDPGMLGVCSGLDWLCFTDLLNECILHGQNYSLMRYFPFLPAAFHHLYAANSVPRINYPHSHYEAFTKTQHTKNALLAMLNEIPPAVQSRISMSCLCLDILSLLLELISPKLRPVNPQLYSTREKQQLYDLIDTMINYNLTYRQDRTPEGQYTYKTEVKKQTSRNHQQRLENIVKQTVVESEDGKGGGVVHIGKAVGNSDVWFRFNEGVSNAVRRNVYIRELL